VANIGWPICLSVCSEFTFLVLYNSTNGSCTETISFEFAMATRVRSEIGKGALSEEWELCIALGLGGAVCPV
jgi:hypothetical protein